MEQEELNYNIHNILKFKIIRDKSILFKDLNLEHSFFKVDEVENPELTINIGKFTPSNDDCYLVDHKYHARENYFYCKDAIGNTKWEVEIFGFEEGDTTINFNIRGIRGLIPTLPFQNFLLDSLIEYKLSKKGYYVIHSAGIRKDDEAYLFAGRGGSFKSSLVMDFVRRKNFDFMGDDKVIICREGVLDYPLDFPIFNFKVNHLPMENYRTILDRFRLMKYIWKDADHMHHIKKNGPQISKLKKLFFIVKKNTDELYIKKTQDTEKDIARLIINNKLEMNGPSSMPNFTGMVSNHYYKYMLIYSFVFPDSRVAAYWDDFKKGMGTILREIPTSEIEVPYKYDLNIFNEICEFIGDTGKA